MSENIRKKLIEALCELPHVIDDEKIVIHYSHRLSGHNVLNQLLTALEARFADPKPSQTPLLDALRAIAAPRDCGCSPSCQCNSQESLEIEVEELRDIARHALIKFTAGIVVPLPAPPKPSSEPTP